MTPYHTVAVATPGLRGTPPRNIRGLRLRELLVLILVRHGGPMTVPALVAAVHAGGFGIQGRPGKVVSDQLRYEVARGRVRRVGRGVYVAGTVSRQARWRMQRRITALRAAPHGNAPHNNRDGQPAGSTPA